MGSEMCIRDSTYPRAHPAVLPSSSRNADAAVAQLNGATLEEKLWGLKSELIKTTDFISSIGLEV